MVCHGEPGIRAVLLTGEGKNFCAGGDIHDFASKGEKLPDYLGRRQPICKTRSPD